MSLEKRINKDITAAMLARDKIKLDALRAVKAAILLARTEKGTVADDLDEAMETRIVQKLVKQRKESADLYQTQGREDLAEEEKAQMLVIEHYLPAQMSEEDVKHIIEGIITETGASSIRDMGNVMGLASKKIAGKAENKLIADLIREKLNQ